MTRRKLAGGEGMAVWPRVTREVRFLRGLAATLARVRGIRPDSPDLVCDDIEAAVDRHASRIAFTLDGRTLTYGEFDALANRYAHWATQRGIKRGDTVALLATNRLEYVAIWYGLSKVGVTTALLNSSLVGAALVHCLTTSGAQHLIADMETAPAFEAMRGRLPRPMVEWIVGGPGDHDARLGDRDLDQTLKGVSSLRPSRDSRRAGLTARDTVLYIFTSGTTGLPKAARVTHARAQLYMRGFAGATAAKPTDRVYLVLPLCHATGGLCAVGAALLNGGTVVLRRRFSASLFWSDIKAEEATMFAYVGELCRYLVNQSEDEAERGHHLRLIFGNGLRPDVWERLEARFRIPRILEFYGSTEGNVSLFNYDGRSGAVGRVPKYLRSRFNVRLARFDVATDVPERDARGLCIPCATDEVGEALGAIGADARSSYTGYADKAESERKVLHDVFAPGDAWFRTGDLMRQDADGYFYFVDRIGDTFRWKGENVSTSEVAERLGEVEGVQQATVYGVEAPGSDGRAGMASLVVGPGFQLAALQAKVDEALPPYARPVFLRLQPEIETTGTFKYRKADLVQQGFDPGRTSDPLYVRSGLQGYVPLDPKVYQGVTSGAFKL